MMTKYRFSALSRCSCLPTAVAFTETKVSNLVDGLPVSRRISFDVLEGCLEAFVTHQPLDDDQGDASIHQCGGECVTQNSEAMALEIVPQSGITVRVANWSFDV